MTDRELLQQALDALVEVLATNRATRRLPETVMQAEAKLDRVRNAAKQTTETIAALRQRLAQPEVPDCGEYGHSEGACGNASCTIAAAPQKGAP